MTIQSSHRLNLAAAAFCAGALLLGLSPTRAAAPAPRVAVGEIADAIQARYFDPERAARIASDLKAEIAAGKFDGLTDPRDLATALTLRLKTVDQHFSVEWRPKGADAGPGGPLPPQMDNQSAARRGAYGFRDVSILPGNVGLIHLREFDNIDFSDPNDPARKAADSALQLVSNTDAVIIDLRDNGGGAPSMVGYLVSAFTPADADIYNTFHTRQGTRQEKPAIFYPHPRLDVPLYILTSGRTGSAAEGLSYTLQSAHRATIVGEHSAGGANPGGAVPTPSGFSVFISTGSPVNPITHTNWEGKGVLPEVETPSEKAQDAAWGLALEAALNKGLTGAEAIDARWALEALKARTGAPIAFDAAAYEGQYGPVKIAADDAGLKIDRGRQPPGRLLAVGGDAFAYADDPTQRVLFERGPDGKAVALEVRTSGGRVTRFRRGG